MISFARRGKGGPPLGDVRARNFHFASGSGGAVYSSGPQIRRMDLLVLTSQSLDRLQFDVIVGVAGSRALEHPPVRKDCRPCSGRAIERSSGPFFHEASFDGEPIHAGVSSNAALFNPKKVDIRTETVAVPTNGMVTGVGRRTSPDLAAVFLRLFPTPLSCRCFCSVSKARLCHAPVSFSGLCLAASIERTLTRPDNAMCEHIHA